TVGIEIASVEYNSKDVLEANQITVRYTLDNDNYSLSDDVFDASINPLKVNLSGSRVYDGTTKVSGEVFGTIDTGVGTETLSVSGEGSVASKDVSAGSQTLTLGTLKLISGTGDASNYTLEGGTHTASVTAKV